MKPGRRRKRRPAHGCVGWERLEVAHGARLRRPAESRKLRQYGTGEREAWQAPEARLLDDCSRKRPETAFGFRR